MKLKLTLFIAMSAAASFAFAADPNQNVDPPQGQTKAWRKPSTLKPSKNFDEAAKRILIQPLPDSLAKNSGAVAVAKSLERMRKETLQHIHQMSGLMLTEDCFVQVLFLEFPPKDAPLTYAITTQLKDKKSARIRVFLSLILRDGKDMRKIFYHEMTHAVQITWTYGGYYWTQPRWFMEGLGNYVGEDDIGLIASSRGRPKRIRGLDNPKGNVYLEGGLMFEYIEHQWGADTVKAIIRDVTITHISVMDALKKHTRTDWRTFSANARKFAVNYLTSGPPPKVAQTPPTSAPSVRPMPPPTRVTEPVPSDPVRAPADVSRVQSFGWILHDVEDVAGDSSGATKSSVMIVAIAEDSPAARAGLEAGDVLLSLDGKTARNAVEFSALLGTVKPGATCVLQISREGKAISIRSSR